MTFFDVAGAALTYDWAPAADSVRDYDPYGRLRIKVANISKATVNDYVGRDVPRWRELGLDADRTYRVLRPPDELAKAAATFNNVPILDRHVSHSAKQPRQNDTIGTTGSDARFEDPYLRVSLAFWVDDAIDDIDDDERRELSCSYNFTPVVEAGVFRGMAYDLRMTEIIGNHVALVEEGRAGHDVVVGDSKPVNPNPKGITKMPKGQTALSTAAGMVRGALAAHLLPLLVDDAKVDFRRVVRGVTAENYRKAKPIIVARLAEETKGKFKVVGDANLKDVHGLLDRLDGQTEQAKSEDVEAVPGIMGEPADPQQEIDNPAVDADPAEMIIKHLEGKIPPELMDEIKKMAEAGEPGDPEPENEGPPAAVAPEEDEAPQPPEEEEMKKLNPADRKKAQDGYKAACDAWKAAKDARDKAAKDAKDKAARDKRARDALPRSGMPGPAMRPPGVKDNGGPMMDKKAMDSAISAACAATEKRTIRRMRDIADAVAFVRPIVGDVDILVQDSAEDVYALAMDELNIDRKGIHPSAYRTILEVAHRPKRRAEGAGNPRLASDARGTDDLAKRDPNFGRLRRVA